MKNTILKILYIGILLVVSKTYSQSVSGTVTEESGMPIPGVNVVVQGTNKGASTDFDGKYTIDNVETGEVLVFSSLSFTTKQVTFSGQTELNVIMVSDVESLGEVVILGYGQAQNKKTVTTALSTVTADQIRQLPISQAEAALQGTVPGVVVQQNSGSPGSPQTVRIRGVGSPNNSNPLFIVDGVQVPNLNFLNPNDIVSQTVLKDAASTAIYGSRGGNGVVLIETLKGKRQSGKTNVSIRGSYGIQSLQYKPELLNRDQFVEYYNQAVAEAGGSLAAGFRGAYTDAERLALPDTDWYDELFNEEPVQDIYASVSGGGDRMAYSVSGGYFGQIGILGGEGKSEFRRRNIRATIDADITDKISFSGVAQYQKQDRFTIFQNNGGAGTGISSFINALPAIYPVFDQQGNYFNPGFNGSQSVNGIPVSSIGAIANPAYVIASNDNQSIQDAINLSFSATWKPIENLIVTGTYGAFDTSVLFRNFQPLIEEPEQQNFTTTTTFYQESRSDIINRQWGGTAEYTFDKFTGDNHNLNALFGYEVVENRFDGGATVRDPGSFLTNDFEDVNFGLSANPADATITPGVSQEIGLESYFGRLNYNYREKYLFSAVLRNDKSSNFGPNKRNGWFPSFSAGWVASEETFLQNVDAINLLKIRGSWGISGTDASPRALAYLSSVNTTVNYAGQPGIVLTGIANPNLKWEELKQYNIGLDINALNNKLGFTIDYYSKETSDILLQATTPLTSGLTPSVENVGAVENSGFEILVSYRDSYDNGLSWNISANAGFNKNEVTDLGETTFLQGAQITPQFNDFASRTQVGNPIASFYGFVVEGIDANGNLVFADLDNSGNNKLNPDEGDKTIIGNPNPDMSFGINLGLNYKNFDFAAFMSGTVGNDIFDATVRYDALGVSRPASYIEEPGAPRNVSLISAGSTLPLPLNGEQLISDYHVKDGSFMKIKNVTLGYSLPESALKSTGIERIRLYVSGQNLVTFTKYTGVDPEIGQNNINSPLNIGIDQGFFPQARQFVLGFNVDF